MEIIYCTFNSLAGYGFNVLTGESDALMFRMLCDLNYHAVKIYCTAFGLKLPTLEALEKGETIFAENWNSGSVASILLEQADVRKLGIIALWWHSEITMVIDCVKEGNHTLIGLEENEDFKNDGTWLIKEDADGLNFTKHINSWYDDYKIRFNGEWQPFPSSYGKVNNVWRWKGRSCDRNKHQMTGRIV